MNLKLEIRRNADGAMTSQIWTDWDFHAYWWEGGSAGCDCNREDFFLQAQGENTDDRESECGDERYSVRCSDADTGAVLYDELFARAALATTPPAPKNTTTAKQENP